MDTRLAQRLDQFLDAQESQVGDTMFIRARNLERELGFGQIWLKFEGDNPTGTQKDRIAWAQVYDALRRGFDTVTVATCGNFGVALGVAARAAGLQARVVVPASYHTRRTMDAQVIRYGRTYEEAVEHSRRLAAEEGAYDANPGGENVFVQLQAYAAIAEEVVDQLRDAPAVVACPVSNGTTLAGIWRGFVSQNRRGRTSRLPRMAAGSAWRQNPIVKAQQQKLDACPLLQADELRETAVNEPLINWHSIDGDLALDALRASGGHAVGVGDRRMRSMARLLREQMGLHVLPASTAGLLALADLHTTHPLPPDRYVAVLTGRSS